MRRNPLLVLAGLSVLIILAYVWREPIYEMFIVPLAYLWWAIRLYYHFFPQVIYWAVLIFAVLYTATRTLLVEFSFGRSQKAVAKTHQGPVEKLSHLLEKRENGMYYKWLIANRLGNLARDILHQRERLPAGKRSFQLSGRNWNPPQDISRYLEAGVNGSFADHSQANWFNAQATPLDEDPQKIIDYLESEMEPFHNGHRESI
jgi:hypothetical protein